MKRACLVAITIAGFVQGASAHEIGKTQVIATFHADDRYAIEMVVDPDAFLAKLEALAGVPPSGASTPEARTTRVMALQHAFLARSTAAFDGWPATPRFEYLEGFEWRPNASGPAGPAGVRLTGTVPSGARTFTWRSSIIFGSYALIAKTDDDREGVTEWLEGGRDSTPFGLASRQVDRRLIVPAVGVFVALGLFRIVERTKGLGSS